MLNKVIIQGRLVAEPELRHTAQGTAVANVRMAVDRDFKRPDGRRISSRSSPGAAARSFWPSTSTKGSWPVWRADCKPGITRITPASGAS